MRRILIVRLDAIGDAILFGEALRRLARLYDGAEIGVACRPEVAPLHERNPMVDRVFTVDMAGATAEDGARDLASESLSEWGPDILINPTRSREGIAESIVRRVHAGVKLALAADTSNATDEELAAYDSAYDRIGPSAGTHACELAHHAELIRWLSDSAELPVVRPEVTLDEGDRRRAGSILHERSIDPARSICAFVGSRWRYKNYPMWGEALFAAFEHRTEVETIVLLGGSDAAKEADNVASVLCRLGSRLRVENLVGGCDLMTTIALIGHLRACVGNDTFAVHAACAMGIPNAAVLGGGHPGRFLPYDPLTSCAMRPLTCMKCDWWCRFDRVHCVKSVPIPVVAGALGAVLDPAGFRPLIFVPKSDHGETSGPSPAALPADLVSRVEVRPVRIDGHEPGAAFSRLTVSASAGRPDPGGSSKLRRISRLDRF